MRGVVSWMGMKDCVVEMLQKKNLYNLPLTDYKNLKRTTLCRSNQINMNYILLT